MSERKANYPIQKIILNRWSARAMSGENLSDEELMPLFEAARWAPSSMNNQLWRFIYAKRKTKYFESFFNLLSEGNKAWCKNASVLIILISRKISYYKNTSQNTHSLEAGMAFENLALEGTSRKLVVHGMAGFSKEKAKKLLKLSDKWSLECMIAVGKQGKKSELPEELGNPKKPSDRIPLKKIVFEGEFNEE